MWTPDVYEGAPTPVTDLLRLGAEDGGDGDPGARRHHRLSRHLGRMAADRHLHLDRLDGARLLRRDRADQHQAADGLFVDRPHGLRAGRPRRRHGRGRAWRHRLHVDLSRDDARAPSPASCRCGATAGYVETIADLAGLARTNRADGVLPRRDDVLARRHSAARRLLRQVLRLRRGDQGRSLRPRGDRRAAERGRRLLLSAHRQDHVFRRAGQGFRPDRASPPASCSRCRRRWSSSTCSRPRR